jgi:hypothetical protein
MQSSNPTHSLTVEDLIGHPFALVDHSKGHALRLCICRGTGGAKEPCSRFRETSHPESALDCRWRLTRNIDGYVTVPACTESRAWRSCRQ